MKKNLTVQENKASGKARRTPNITITYTPTGPTLGTLLKDLLRTTFLPGQTL